MLCIHVLLYHLRNEFFCILYYLALVILLVFSSMFSAWIRLHWMLTVVGTWGSINSSMFALNRQLCCAHLKKIKQIIGIKDCAILKTTRQKKHVYHINSSIQKVLLK